ncbi:putative esterase of the alpha-beta hydrolase superfamily [Halobacteroides halobius DSM 5150]|uniref:Putative esterase of the alpha-beta hydrolase superfamily n=1 Tax=Halobacteroides halobius (strain ATCC 35273 / DSM 5150 / MD-1) TaxID=748449 RepID=L0KA26_HALHC|nr:putative esterase of the alpha-beta hydrolase superfamily [Halobacteroides halobius DSM 5150]
MSAKIGLALGAGSARGIAHIGVLKALQEEGIAIDYLAGASIGSVVGGFYAAGSDLHMLERLAIHLEWDHFTDITVSKQGLVAGNKVKEFFQLLTKGKTFADLNLPFSAVAADIEKGEEVVIKEGLVADALRASMSIPGIYIPYELEGKKLVDGAVLNRVPVSAVKEEGADIAIGVEVSYNLVRSYNVNTIFDVIMSSIDIMQQEIAQHKNVEADILIVPEVGHIASTDLSQAQECIQLGYQAAKEKIPEIKRLINEYNKETAK